MAQINGGPGLNTNSDWLENNNTSTFNDSLKLDMANSSVGSDYSPDDSELDPEMTIEDYTEELGRLKARVVKDRIEHKREMDALIQKHAATLDGLKTTHGGDVEAVKRQIKDELLREHTDKLNVITDELEDTHNAEIDELQDRHKDEVKKLKLEIDNKDLELQQSVKEMDELRQHEIQQLEADHLEKLDLAVKKARLECSTTDLSIGIESQKMKEQYQNEIQQLKLSLKEKLAQEKELWEQEKCSQIEEKYHEKIKELESSLEAAETQAEEGERKLKEQFQEMDQDFRTRLEEVEKHHTEEMEKVKSQHENNVQQKMEEQKLILQQENQAELTELKSSLQQHRQDVQLTEELTKKLDELQARLEQSEKDRTALEAELEENKALLEKLKEKEGKEIQEDKEDQNDLKTLKEEIENLKQDRDRHQNSSDQYLTVLSDTVKSIKDTERKINKKLTLLTGQGRRLASTPTNENPPDAAAEFGQNESKTEDLSMLSNMTDEGLYLSEHLMESIFIGPEVDQEVVTAKKVKHLQDVVTHMQFTVERLLDMMVDTTDQLHEAHTTQRELAETLTLRSQEVEALKQRVEEMEHRLQDETSTREILTVELNKTAGLLAGSETEKQTADDTIQHLEERRASLAAALEQSQASLQAYQETQSELTAREEDLQRQREVLADNLTEEAQGLLEENSRISAEKREVVKQNEAQIEDLTKKVQILENGLEDAHTHSEVALEEKRAIIEDLHNQVENYEKQLKSHKQFMEDQGNDREQEREEFNQEIRKLKASLKNQERQDNADLRRQREYQDLEEQLREKTDNYNELILTKEQLEQDLETNTQSLSDFRVMIRKLEEELEERIRAERTAREKIDSLELELSRHQDTSESESEHGDEPLVYKLRQTIKDLESQLETSQHNNQTANQRTAELEAESKRHASLKAELELEMERQRTVEEELTHDKEELQSQVYNQLEQISQLKAQIEKLRIGVESQRVDESTLRDLKLQLEAEQEASENTHKEVRELEDQLERFREQVLDREEDLNQLTAQLSISEKQQQSSQTEMRERIEELQTHNQKLTIEVESLRKQAEAPSMPAIAQQLLDDKNKEIDELSEQISELQEKLDRQADDDNKTQLKQLNTTLLSTKESLRTKDDEIVELKQELSSQTEEKVQLQQELASRDQQHQQITEELTAHKEKMSLEQAIQKQKTELLERRERELASLRKTLQKSEEEKEELQRELTKRDQKITQVEEELNNQSVADKGSHTVVQQLSQQVEALQTDIGKLKDYQGKLESDNTESQNLLQDKQREVEELTRDLADIGRHGDGMSAETQSELEQEVTRLRREAGEHRNSLEEKEDEIFALNEKVEQLDEELQQFQDYESLKLEVDVLSSESREKDEIIQEQEQELAQLRQEKNSVHPGELQERLQALVSHGTSESPQYTDNVQSREGTEAERLRDIQSDESQSVSEIEALTSQIQDKDYIIEDLETQLEQVKDALTAQQTKTGNEQQILEMEELAFKLQEKDLDIENLQSQVEELQEKTSVDNQSDVRKLKNTLKEKENALSDLESQVTQIQNELSTATKMVEELQDDATRGRQQEAEVSRLKEELELMASQMRHADGTEEEVIRQHQTITEKDKTNDMLQQKCQKYQGQMKLKDDKIKTLTSQQRELQLQTANLTEHVGRVEEQYRHRVAALERQLALTKQELEALQTASQEMSSIDMDETTEQDRMKEIVDKLREEGEHLLRMSQEQEANASLHLESKAAWGDERTSLLSAIQALKDLLSDTQRAANVSKEQDSCEAADWRGKLLNAIHLVFSREQEGLLAQSRTQATLHGKQGSLSQLEDEIKRQGVEQAAAMKQLLNADRQSMLAEISSLRQQLQSLTRQRAESEQLHSRQRAEGDQPQRRQMAEGDQLLNRRGADGDHSSKREQELSRQLELLEYKLKQEKVICDDLKRSFTTEQGRTRDLHHELSGANDRITTLEIQLRETHDSVGRIGDSLNRKQQKISTLASNLDEERNRTQQLGQAYINQKSSFNQLENELDLEKQRSSDYELHSSETIQKTPLAKHYITEKLKQELESEKDHRLEAEHARERERLLVEKLQRDLDLEQRSAQEIESSYKVQVTELKNAIETEQARYENISSALRRERNLAAELRGNLDVKRGSEQNTNTREKAMIADLQAMLDLEKSKMLDIKTMLDRERRKIANLNISLESERKRAASDLQQERAVIKQLRETLQDVQERNQDFAIKLDEMEAREQALQEERHKLEEDLAHLEEERHETVERADTSLDRERRKIHEVKQERDRIRARLLASETESDNLRQKISDMQLQLIETKSDSTRSPGQRSHQSGTSSSPLVNGDSHSPGDKKLKEGLSLLKKQLESLQQRHLLLIMRHKDQLERQVVGGSSYHDVGSSINDPVLSSIQRELADIQRELHALQDNITRQSQVSFSPSISTSVIPALNERILAHNHELTSFVSRLTEEKQELRRVMSRLEEEVWHYRRKETTISRVNHDTLEQVNKERSLWQSERKMLMRQLKAVEQELVNLRHELRRREDRGSTGSLDSLSSHSDREKMQRMYGKYLRAESFRKALIYQKKYLLILLGGFRDTEKEVLTTLATMGAFKSEDEMHPKCPHTRPINKFRSAVRVVIAIHRLKFLVRKWRHATSRVTSPSSSSANILTVASYVPSSQDLPSPSPTSPKISTDRPSTPHSASNPRSLSKESHDHRRGSHDHRQGSHDHGRRSHITFRTPPTQDKGFVNGSIHGSTSVRRSLLSGGHELVDRHVDGASSHRTANGSTTPDDDEGMQNYMQQLNRLKSRLDTVSNSRKEQSPNYSRR